MSRYPSCRFGVIDDERGISGVTDNASVPSAAYMELRATSAADSELRAPAEAGNSIFAAPSAGNSISATSNGA